VSATWVTIAVLAVGTITIKATGPIAMGGRPLPPRMLGFIALLAPSLLAALVAVETFGAHRALVVDARLAGLAAAGVAMALRQSMIVVVIVAAVATAATRALS
jgi:branched-subunit amino acid transport protein